MRRRLNKKELWAIVLATGTVAASSACSAVDDNDKTQNPRMSSSAGAGATPAGDAGTTGGGGTATGGSGQ
jgi:hypothetical protein